MYHHWAPAASRCAGFMLSGRASMWDKTQLTKYSIASASSRVLWYTNTVQYVVCTCTCMYTVRVMGVTSRVGFLWMYKFASSPSFPVSLAACEKNLESLGKSPGCGCVPSSYICIVSNKPEIPPDPVLKKEYCSVELTEHKFKAFAYAIRNHYWYQMYIGQLPICMYLYMYVCMCTVLLVTLATGQWNRINHLSTYICIYLKW